ncbi:unnamed protein product [Calypogeia fissa]
MEILKLIRLIRYVKYWGLQMEKFGRSFLGYPVRRLISLGSPITDSENDFHRQGFVEGGHFLKVDLIY